MESQLTESAAVGFVGLPPRRGETNRVQLLVEPMGARIGILAVAPGGQPDATIIRLIGRLADTRRCTDRPFFAAKSWDMLLIQRVAIARKVSSRGDFLKVGESVSGHQDFGGKEAVPCGGMLPCDELNGSAGAESGTTPKSHQFRGDQVFVGFAFADDFDLVAVDQEFDGSRT